MKIFSIYKAAFLILACSQHCMANGNPTALILQVPQSFYDHPVHLLHPFMNYWHDRANAAQTAGTAAFEAYHFQTSSCDSESHGQALVVLEPNMFYNPKQGIFYSEITAKIYTGNTPADALNKPLLTVKTEGQSFGTLTHNAELFAQRSYQQAFDRLLQQLQSNTVFQQSVLQAPTQTYQALCNSIDTLAKPKTFY